MAKHRVPSAHVDARRALTYPAFAVGVICIGLAGAAPAQAKTHHGFDAPGNPYASSAVNNTAGGQVGGSFTTIRVIRLANGGVTVSDGYTTQTGAQQTTSSGSATHHLGRGAGGTGTGPVNAAIAGPGASGPFGGLGTGPSRGLGSGPSGNTGGGSSGNPRSGWPGTGSNSSSTSSGSNNRTTHH
jgi:hypothetical protein